MIRAAGAENVKRPLGFARGAADLTDPARRAGAVSRGGSGHLPA